MELKTVLERYHATAEDEPCLVEPDQDEDVFLADKIESAEPAASVPKRQIPVRSVALAMSLFALGALAAVLWGDNFKTDRQNEPKIVGVPEAADTTMTQNPTPENPTPENPPAVVAQATQAPPPAPSRDEPASVDNSGSEPTNAARDSNAFAGAVASSEGSSQAPLTEKSSGPPVGVAAKKSIEENGASSITRRSFPDRSRVVRRPLSYPGPVQPQIIGTAPDGKPIWGFPTRRASVVVVPTAREFYPRYRLRHIRRPFFLPPQQPYQVIPRD